MAVFHYRFERKHCHFPLVLSAIPHSLRNLESRFRTRGTTDWTAIGAQWFDTVADQTVGDARRFFPCSMPRGFWQSLSLENTLHAMLVTKMGYKRGAHTCPAYAAWVWVPVSSVGTHVTRPCLSLSLVRPDRCFSLARYTRWPMISRTRRPTGRVG